MLDRRDVSTRPRLGAAIICAASVLSLLCRTRTRRCGAGRAGSQAAASVPSRLQTATTRFRFVAFASGFIIVWQSIASALPVQALFEETVQYALEHFQSGSTVSTTAAATTFTVTPLRTWKSVSGHYCRRFELAVTTPDGAVDRQERTRCRDDGIWKPATTN